MRVGGLSRYVRVVSWLEYDGFRVGARVSVSKGELLCKRFTPIESEMRDNTAHGEFIGVETLKSGRVYELSMYELLNLGDCPELNLQLDNCYLDRRIISRDSSNRVVLEFCERGVSVGNLVLGSEEYSKGLLEGTVVGRDWAILQKPVESIEVVDRVVKPAKEEYKGYGTSIEID